MKDIRTRAELMQALDAAREKLVAARDEVDVQAREARRIGAELALLKSAPPRMVEVLPVAWPTFIGEAYAAGFEACRRRSLLPKEEDE